MLRLLLAAMLLVTAPVTAQEFEQVNTISPQTLTNKTLGSPTTIQDPTITGTISGAVTISTATLPSPTITGTVAGGASYTSPTITGTVGGSATYATPTLSGPTVSGTVVGTYSLGGTVTILSPTITGTIAGTPIIPNATLTTPTLSLQSYTKAGLPVPGTAGRIARVSDDVRGIWMDQGSQWFALNAGAVNVAEFNAKGDGSTDDTAAIQAAITAANGKVLVFPPPVTSYKISDELVVSNVKGIIGIGKPLIVQTGTNKRVLVASNPSNFSIQGLRIQGEGTGATLADTGCIDITGGTRVWIEENEIFNCRNGIAASTITHLWITKNHIHDFRKQGVVASKSVNFHIDDNSIHTSDSTGVNLAYGINATGDQAGGFTQQRSSINGNTVYGIPTWDGIMTHDVDGLEISGNDIRDVREGIDIGHLTSDNIIKNVTIANNYIQSTATDTWGGSNAPCSGIAIVGYSASSMVSGVTITGNTVRGFAAYSQATGAGGVWVQNASGVVVNGNSLLETHTKAAGHGTGGVIMIGTVAGVSIQGNVITDAVSDSTVFAINFYAAIAASQITITGNTFRNDTAGMSFGVQTKNGTVVTGLTIGPNNSNLGDNNYFSLGSGTTVTWGVGTILPGSATLNFAAPGGVPGLVDLTVTVSGAVPGDKCLVTAPASYGAGFILDGFSNLAETCTVRWVQLTGGAADPDGAGGTYSVKVVK